MADDGEISKATLKHWEDATPDGKKLPERVKKALAYIKHANGSDSDEEAEEGIPITEGKKVPNEALTTFFTANPAPVDAQIHELATAYGTDPHTMETQIYKMLGDKMKTGSDMVPGGKGDKKSPSDFNAEDLAKGRAVEMEHTDNPALATEITMDHGSEFKLGPYYEALDKMEKKLESEGNKVGSVSLLPKSYKIAYYTAGLNSALQKTGLKGD